MKMTKKIALGALAAIAFVLTGCPNTIGNGPDSINGRIISGTTEKAYVGKKDGEGVENKTSKTDREMKLFATKHEGAFAALTLKGETQTELGNGQLGVVFNYTENKENGKVVSVNFITVGYRNNAGTMQSYISQFYNISTEEFDAQNFGVSSSVDNRVKGTDFFVYQVSSEASANSINVEEIKATKKPTEIMFKPANSDNDGFFTVATWDQVKNGTGDDLELTIGVEIVSKDNGSYDVNYYKTVSDKYKKTAADATADITVNIPAKVTGNSGVTQAKMGCYAAVYAGKTLNGFWRFSSIKGEDFPVEGFED